MSDLEHRVSIITPCYNGARFIAETIDSVINQTYPDWELLIIDDGSTDNSAEIVRTYLDKDSRIHLIEQENAGSAAARNNGIRRAEGRYIALLDADDVWEPDFLIKQLAFMKEKNASCVYCSYKCIDAASNEILKPVISKPLITLRDMEIRNYIGCLSGLYDTQKYGKVYLHEELRSIRDDYAYWLDIVKLAGKAYGNPEILAKYRILSNSTTGKKYRLIKKQYYFYRNYLKQNVFQGVFNVFRWGIAGIKKYL